MATEPTLLRRVKVASRIRTRAPAYPTSIASVLSRSWAKSTLFVLADLVALNCAYYGICLAFAHQVAALAFQILYAVLLLAFLYLCRAYKPMELRRPERELAEVCKSVSFIFAVIF